MKKSTIGVKQLPATKNENYPVVVPPWLIVMYNTMFFGNCLVHQNTKQNELDRFCIDCLSSFCPHCLPAHTLHKHVKIRRYVYKDVINRHDLRKLFNCSGIQSYHTNKIKVLFLKQRNHQQQINSKEHSCISCGKNLKDNSLYCSIACKVVAVHGDRHKEEYNNHNLKTIIKNENEDKDEDEDDLTPPLPNRQNRARSRKGVPIRAPLL